MRRVIAIITVFMLAGCVYDPYTGTYVPCCNYYGAPYYYRYPQPYYPYGYPSGPYTAPPPAGYGAPPQAAPPRPGASAAPPAGGRLAERFAAAHGGHDGRLTAAQAAAGMPMVAQNFDAIDRDGKGYVTLPDVRAFAAERRAERSQPDPPTAQ